MDIAMPEELKDDIHSVVKSLEFTSKLVKILVCGAFIIGGWVVKVQIELAIVERDTADNAIRMRAMEIREATSSEKLKNIETVVNRIDRKLNHE